MILDGLVQVLSNPAWQGAGVIVSSALSLIALYQVRQRRTQQISPPLPNPQKNSASAIETFSLPILKNI
jgi:hypothetical protein